MAATTLKLPPELKDRVKAVAEKTGKSPHAFMVEAIEQQTALAEKRREFVAAALAARRNFSRTGKAYALEDVRKYLAARIAGKPARKPRLKRWRG
jgi:predicted transcriptional regulator